MAYKGFLATEELYEIDNDGDPDNGSWVIPVHLADEYPRLGVPQGGWHLMATSAVSSTTRETSCSGCPAVTANVRPATTPQKF